MTCGGDGTGEDALGIVEDGALGIAGGRVAWVGTTREWKRKGTRAKRVLDAGGMLVTPGFVDPHTHLVFAGSREEELERKASGESYTSILASGGGIARTIRETREAPIARIVTESRQRLGQLVRNGVTTVEVKTGYGQDVRGELKLLRAIEILRAEGTVELVPTFLGLHATPTEFSDSGEYVRYAINELLPRVSRLEHRPTFSDCFCEPGVFSVEECRRYLKASEELGFERKIHADEFSNSGGASLAAETRCVSADHLGSTSGSGFIKLAARKVTAVLLPGTALFSSIGFADARRALTSGCTVALGSDLSPNSWVESPQLVMSLACTQMKMTPAQALMGFTANAAKALRRVDVGRLRVGGIADIVIHDLRGYRFLPYAVGGSYVRSVFRAGRPVYEAALP